MKQTLTAEMLSAQFDALHRKDHHITRRKIARDLSTSTKTVHEEYISQLFRHGLKLETLGLRVKTYMDRTEHFQNKELRARK
jgi:hypothetical protein